MHRVQVGGFVSALLVAAAVCLGGAGSSGASPPSNVRVTVDTGSSYVSADVMGGTGTYTDSVLQRCGIDQRPQNEPTIAVDPRNPAVQTAGANDYCTVPTAGDAWAGFYRSTDGGGSWTDSLLPGYLGDGSPQGLASPLHAMTQQGALAAGDPVQAWDSSGDLFYIGNNFNRGTENGKSPTFRNNNGDIWVATYAPSDPSNTLTDGSRYVRTVLLDTQTFGQGVSLDKTALGVDPSTGDVFAAWSKFNGNGCNQILLSRSTDHGATFSAPLKLSSGICNNQGPEFAFGPSGQVYVTWVAFAKSTTPSGAVFTSSLDGGKTFAKASVVVPYTPFESDRFAGNGARECGDPPLNCPSGFTFPRFDVPYPVPVTDGSEILMALPVALPSGQGQIQLTSSSDGGATWSTPSAIDPQATGHQFFPSLAASDGTITAIYYDSRADSAYAPVRPPCNDAAGVTYACLAVWSSTSTDGGATWTHSVVTNTLTNPNLEQFSRRAAPFFGDYITVSAAGGTIAAAWTDQRDAVLGTEPAGADGDNADVAGDPETGGTCTSTLDACFDTTGGLDQNIYSAQIGS